MSKFRDKDLITTGEAVKLMDGLLSRSTISRYFDKGRLKGEKNPITGKRMINRDDLRRFARRHGV